MLAVLIVALVLGFATDWIVTRVTKVAWLGTLVGIGVCVVALIVGFGVSK